MSGGYAARRPKAHPAQRPFPPRKCRRGAHPSSLKCFQTRAPFAPSSWSQPRNFSAARGRSPVASMSAGKCLRSPSMVTTAPASVPRVSILRTRPNLPRPSSARLASHRLNGHNACGTDPVQAFIKKFWKLADFGSIENLCLLSRRSFRPLGFLTIF